jgi:hypothetical protein
MLRAFAKSPDPKRVDRGKIDGDKYVISQAPHRIKDYGVDMDLPTVERGQNPKCSE